MSFDWQNYLILASDLITRPIEPGIEEEAYYRAAVSRSYYSVYMLAFNFIQQHPIYKQQYLHDIKPIKYGGNGKGSHQAVRNILMQSSNRNEKNIGTQLKILHKHRKDADYETYLAINLGDAEIAYNTAEKILNDLKIIGAA